MVLHNRILRELKANFLRYTALFFLIALSLFVVLGMVCSAETVIKTVNDSAKRNRCEDGQFTVLSPMSEKQIEELEADGADIEAMFYLDFEVEDGSVLRVFKMREKINLLNIDKGTKPASRSQLVLEKLYAGAHNYSVNDVIDIGAYSFTVSAVCSTPDYDLMLQNITDVAADKNHFGTAFVNEDAYKKLKDSAKSIRGEEYVYAYRLNDGLTHDELKDKLSEMEIERDMVTDKLFIDILDELDEPKNDLLDNTAELVNSGASLEDALEELGASGDDLIVAFQQLPLPDEQKKLLSDYVAGVKDAADGSGELQDGLEEFQIEIDDLADEMYGYEIANLTSFIKASSNPRIGASVEDVTINRSSGILAGIIVLILFAYIISVFILHNIDHDSEVIGTLYSLGVSNSTLQRHYLTLPIIIALIGSILGTIAGLSALGVDYQMAGTASYYSFPELRYYHPIYLIIYGLAMPTIVVAVVNSFIIHSRLKRSPLSLLRKSAKRMKPSKINLHKLGFMNSFRIRQILREKRATFAVTGGVFISLLLLILGLNCYSFLDTMHKENEADTKYEYMLNLKYPPDEIPNDTEACYLKNMNKEVYGYDLDISLLGLDAGNKYFDFTPATGVETLTVSTSMANKYNLKAGDTLILKDSIEDKSYVFTVDKIVQYSVGLYAFMDIESMRELFELEEDEYNILLSSEMPDLETDRISSITTKDNILEFSVIFMSMLLPMITLITVISSIILIIVLYLMMKMMIDRSSFGISLIKIFGFNDREVRTLYLDGNLLTILFSLLVGLPLAKIVMNQLFPILVANVAVGPNLAMPIEMYLVIIALVLISYFVINIFLNKNLHSVTPAEVLKQRD